MYSREWSPFLLHWNRTTILAPQCVVVVKGSSINCMLARDHWSLKASGASRRLFDCAGKVEFSIKWRRRIAASGANMRSGNIRVPEAYTHLSAHTHNRMAGDQTIASHFVDVQALSLWLTKVQPIVASITDCFLVLIFAFEQRICTLLVHHSLLVVEFRWIDLSWRLRKRVRRGNNNTIIQAFFDRFHWRANNISDGWS